MPFGGGCHPLLAGIPDWGSSAHLAALSTGFSRAPSLRLVVIAAWGVAHLMALSTSTAAPPSLVAIAARGAAHLVAVSTIFPSARRLALWPTVTCVAARRVALGRGLLPRALLTVIYSEAARRAGGKRELRS